MITAGGTLLVATRNHGKTAEFREAFRKFGVTVKDLGDVEGIPEIEETGTTFEENAFIKAKTVADIVGLPVLADDSGLCVDALNGEPGVYSARYAGEHANDADNNAKLLRELDAGLRTVGIDVTEPEVLSPAQFVSSLVLYDPQDGSRLTAEAQVEGLILREPRGSGGFGYDPLFWLPSFNRSMAELTVEEKNRISHRGQALNKLLELIGR
ncbi:purine NTP phosphatase [Cohnella kolymensis]|uniref:dITP/XTP pyrophosphatase n=1 Tax=Cohnella kolymensis TaxID=1590652 RepID=A0ABR5A718_9BACL|nr:XTP/dITP diphosphatase [Cohnella kolymensis]KIL36786.1 purine NTP phosphatase [Cohnella kolymensis]